MKKQLIVTIKNRFMFNQLYPMFISRLGKQFEEEILDGKMFINTPEWTEKEKGRIVIEMDGTEEEIDAWTKKGFRDRATMGALRPLMKIELCEG